MKNQSHKIAVITRTKDRTVFLERALKSIHNQTIRDFVHVIYDDGGDASAIQSLLDKHKSLIEDRAVVIHAETSSEGPDQLFNQAIKSVDSEYVAVHDDDDSWHPEFLERTVKLLEERQAVGVVVRTDKIIEELIPSEHRIQHLKTEQWMPDVRAISLYRQCIDNQMTPITFVYRRNAYDELGGYDDSLPVIGDWDFGIRFLQKYDVEFLDPGFALANYHHRRYREGVTGNSSFGGGEEKHRYYSNKLINRYLREELAQGKVGVGYIMGKLKYEQGYHARLAQRIMPKFIASQLKKRIQK